VRLGRAAFTLDLGLPLELSLLRRNLLPLHPRIRVDLLVLSLHL
jgi:hypothetical protein